LIGCTPQGCGQSLEAHVAVEVLPLATPVGALADFTIPSSDRVNEAIDHRFQDELLVLVGDGADPGTRQQAEDAATAAGGVVTGGLEDAGIYQVRWKDPQNLDARRQTLLTQPGVTDVAPSTTGLVSPTNAYHVSDTYNLPQWTWPYDQINHPGIVGSCAGEPGNTSGVSSLLERCADLRDRVQVLVSGHERSRGPRCPRSPRRRSSWSMPDAPFGIAWGCPIVSAETHEFSDAYVIVAMFECARPPAPPNGWGKRTIISMLHGAGDHHQLGKRQCEPAVPPGVPDDKALRRRGYPRQRPKHG
jgi:hypothetical protein